MQKIAIGVNAALLLSSLSFPVPTLSQAVSAGFTMANHHLEVNPDDPNVDLSIGLRVGGGPIHYAQVDTGSVGILVSKDLLGPEAVALNETGEREFNSSGRVYQGSYYRAPIELQGMNGNAVTVPLRVLVVEKIICDPVPASTCRSGPVSNFIFVGVGFDRPPFLGRYVSHDLLGPWDNPFLQLVSMSESKMPRRYVLSREEIVLGGPDSDFKLAWLPGRSPMSKSEPPFDWNRAYVTYGLNNPASNQSFSPKAAVPLLVDTGLEYTILTVPLEDRPAGFTLTGSTTLQDGIKIEVKVSERSNSDELVLSYHFRIGDPAAPAYAPTRVVWGSNKETYQLNTGSNLLNSFDYMYDSDRGVIGFRSH